jgi:hypothetical protein
MSARNDLPCGLNEELRMNWMVVGKEGSFKWV